MKPEELKLIDDFITNMAARGLIKVGCYLEIKTVIQKELDEE
ncbi:MAG TPA: hypothetical protein VL854_08725 [Nitrososphaeraceae archaeon]|nr:hypothetical protein [Nitrososphaeraceae archaeon]